MTKRLGKGFAQIVESSVETNPNLVMLQTDQIRPCRYQPRQAIDPEALEELKASIKRRGIIQPIIVRPIAHGTYELVAGERRWRAAQALGIPEIPSLIRAISDEETMEFSLIENLQREDLNPIEEAKAFARLINELGHTQEQLAEAIGKDRTSIANALRLLKLPEEVQQALQDGKITAGHAKALLAVEPTAKQLELFHQALAKALSVRELEQLASQWHPTLHRRRRAQDPQLKAIEDELRQLLGTKVTLTSRKRGGRIVIDYFSSEDLTRLLSVLGVTHGSR